MPFLLAEDTIMYADEDLAFHSALLPDSSGQDYPKIIAVIDRKMFFLAGDTCYVISDNVHPRYEGFVIFKPDKPYEYRQEDAYVLVAYVRGWRFDERHIFVTRDSNRKNSESIYHYLWRYNPTTRNIEMMSQTEIPIRGASIHVEGPVFGLNYAFVKLWVNRDVFFADLLNNAQIYSQSDLYEYYGYHSREISGLYPLFVTLDDYGRYKNAHYFPGLLSAFNKFKVAPLTRDVIDGLVVNGDENFIAIPVYENITAREKQKYLLFDRNRNVACLLGAKSSKVVNYDYLVSIVKVDDYKYAAIHFPHGRYWKNNMYDDFRAYFVKTKDNVLVSYHPGGFISFLFVEEEVEVESV